MNKTRRILVIAIALIALHIATLLGSESADAATNATNSSPDAAKEDTVHRPKNLSCSDSPAGEFAECIGVQLAIFETELQAIFQTLISKNVNEPTRSRLERAQSKWHEFRAAQCELNTDLERYGQDLHLNPLHQNCLLEMAEERIVILQSLAEH